MQPSIIDTIPAGYMSGCGDSYFCPAELVTREDMAIYLVKGEHGTSFTPPAATGIFDDAKKTYCLAPWIEQLYAEGITAGCAANPLRFCPENRVPREQMAVFLNRVLGLL